MSNKGKAKPKAKPAPAKAAKTKGKGGSQATTKSSSSTSSSYDDDDIILVNECICKKAPKNLAQHVANCHHQQEDIFNYMVLKLRMSGCIQCKKVKVAGAIWLCAKSKKHKIIKWTVGTELPPAPAGAAPKRAQAPGQPQPLPPLDQVFEVLQCVRNPPAKINPRVVSEVRQACSDMLAPWADPNATDPARGEALKKFLVFWKLVMVTKDRDYSHSVKSKHALWKAGQFATLLDMARDVVVDQEKGKNRGPPSKLNRQMRARQVMLANRPAKVLDITMPAAFGGQDEC